MRYIKMTYETPYAGTTETEYLAFDDSTTDNDLSEYMMEATETHASSYEYLATGWDDDEMSEDEREEILANYYEDCNGYWEEVDREEWEENDGVEA